MVVADKYQAVVRIKDSSAISIMPSVTFKILTAKSIDKSASLFSAIIIIST